MKKPLVIFDLDGTLYKTESSFIPAIKQLLTEYGLSYPNENLLFSFIGEPPNRFIEWFKTIEFKDNFVTALNKMESLEIKYIKERGHLYPNVLETLEWLRHNNIDIALYTNGIEEYVSQILDKFELNKYFKIIRYHKCNKDSKSEMIKEIIMTLNPKKIYLVGDRYHDIISAKENGCISIGVSYGYGNSEIKDADYLVDNISEMKKIIDFH
jgi:phosphoglycolate phosphatase